jgi:cytochrome c oxidase cbb3-type subunit 2/cytochrome c oxidase cbb3-type subunit I/II
MIAFSACRSERHVTEATLESPEARAHGRALFVAHCALCHGANADGHGQRREGLTGRPVDFTSAAWRASATSESVFTVIRDGKPGTSMPAWRSLDEGSLADLTAYVLSVRDAGGP